MSNVSRQIDERDQWLFNASTNDLVGVKNPTGRGEDFLPVRLDSTGASLVSGAGNQLNLAGISSYYKFYIPGFQFAGSGNAKDRSANAADAVIAAAYTDADTWQNKGYITTEAGTEQYLTIPAAKVTIDLTQKSRLFACVVNRAAPAGNDSIFGNSDGATLRGWAISCRTSGKLYLKTATNGSTQTITADSTAVVCDSTDHAIMLYWARDSRTLSLYVDGILSDTFSSAWDNVAYVASSRDFAIGGLFQNASQTSVALKTNGLHLMEIPGDLPTNIGLIAQKHAANPKMWFSNSDFEF